MDHIAKRQKVDEQQEDEKAVLFNSDTLVKIISYLPSIDVFNLGLTCKQFGISDDDKLSIIKKSVQIIVQDVATEEQLATLPHYDGESSLADYHYLQLMREPLLFDQLCAGVQYVDSEDKTCVRHKNIEDYWVTAFSNNILRAGKHYVTFTPYNNDSGNSLHMYLGVMRPGQANRNASGNPLFPEFFQHFSRHMVHGGDNNDVQCCTYLAYTGKCWTSDWNGSDTPAIAEWEGRESLSNGEGKIGMLLDLDEGTLSIYKNSRKLGVMMRGLAGPYCWVVSMFSGAATIKRGKIPPS